MHVLILSQYYDPEPVPKPAELARELKAAGHEVTVITGFPNYPTGDLYRGYRLRLLDREQIDGVPVSRTYEYPYHGRSVIKRLLNYWSFALTAPLAALRMKRPDVIYVWHPPLTVGVAAWLISRLRGGVPFVYDVQDIWPDSAVLSGMIREGFAVKAMSVLERFIYRRAGHIVVVTEGARQNLIGKRVPPDKVTPMSHWIDESILVEVPDAERVALRAQHGWADGEFVVMFAGNVGMVQGLDTVVRAAKALRDASIRIVIVGDGADKERLQSLARELGTGDRLQFIDRQPMSAMPRYMAASDALLVHLRRSPLSHLIIPTKTLAYLAAGKPVVMASEGAAADLVLKANAGVTLPPDDPEELAATLRRLAALPEPQRAELGRSGKAFLRDTMTKTRVVPQYVELLGRAAAKS